MASLPGCHKSTRLLLEAGADVDAKANDGSTPLHMASLSGCFESSRLLLDAGADADAKRTNDGSTTALQLAGAGGHHEIVWLDKQFPNFPSAHNIP
mmetsp:Transcript_6485/g.15317  ORF Transcript_6485/g.15317 Transcript_6485/m.15317 type:complete len:96 (-) Transcript_6485:1645-1932(-)